MRNLRLTPLGNRITSISLAIGIGTSVIIYIWVVLIGGHSGASGPILVGGLISLLLSGGFGFYFAYLATARIRRIDEAAREVAEGNFATRLPVDHSGQLGQLARTFNEMQRRLTELDSARKQFIANASHELRTPIFSLSGFLELLEDEEPNAEEQAEFLRTMRQQIERLTKLTSDLLNLSQLDAGGVELDPRDVVREFGPRADLNDSRLELRTPERPVVAFADPERVRQIIRILLDNALTHTPEGASVTVTTYSIDRRAELTVSDDGEGIPQRIQQRLFERFYTANPSGGSGLGLAIAREVAQRMEGNVTVSSSRRFTAFTLGLPSGRETGAPSVAAGGKTGA
jgi:two-component system OmpR family sensor kinase